MLDLPPEQRVDADRPWNEIRTRTHEKWSRVDYQTLRFEQQDGVAHLELHRPDAANGINLQLAEELLPRRRASQTRGGSRC